MAFFLAILISMPHWVGYEGQEFIWGCPKLTPARVKCKVLFLNLSYIVFKSGGWQILWSRHLHRLIFFCTSYYEKRRCHGLLYVTHALPIWGYNFILKGSPWCNERCSLFIFRSNWIDFSPKAVNMMSLLWYLQRYPWDQMKVMAFLCLNFYNKHTFYDLRLSSRRLASPSEQFILFSYLMIS